MRSRETLLLVLFAALLASATWAENLRVGDTTYQNIKWGQATDAYVTFFHKRGVAKVLLSELPPALQERFNYDPEAANEELREEEEAEKEAARKKAYADQEEYYDNSPPPKADYDGNMFYLKREVGGSVYGPFLCEKDKNFAVGSTVYDIVKFSRSLFTVKSRRTKNVLGPFWLKDGAVVLLDGTKYELVTPSTMEKEMRKIRSERSKVQEAQNNIIATEESKTLETDASLGNTMKVDESKSLKSLNKNSQYGLKKRSFE